MHSNGTSSAKTKLLSLAKEVSHSRPVGEETFASAVQLSRVFYFANCIFLIMIMAKQQQQQQHKRAVYFSQRSATTKTLFFVIKEKERGAFGEERVNDSGAKRWRRIGNSSLSFSAIDHSNRLSLMFRTETLQLAIILHCISCIPAKHIMVPFFA